jgi:hypothetical protein
MMWKNAVVVYFRALSWRLSGTAEENHVKSQSILAALQGEISIEDLWNTHQEC